MITYRDLTSLADFAQVVELERVIWGVGYDDVVPVPIFAVTVKRGGILIGGFDTDRRRPDDRASSIRCRASRTAPRCSGHTCSACSTTTAAPASGAR